MKRAIVSFIIFNFVLSLNLMTFSANSFVSKINHSKKIMTILMVNKSEVGGEPVLIRGVILDVKKHKKVCVIKVVSQPYKNYIIAIKRCINVNKGEIIKGLLYNDKFVPFKKAGR